MNLLKKIKVIGLLSFFAIAFITGMVWLRLNHLNRIQAQSMTRLNLELSSSQVKFVQLEPIPIVLKLKNQNTVPITWGGTFMLGRDVNLLIRAENGSEVRLDGRDYSGETPIMGAEVLQPGGEQRTEQLFDIYVVERVFPRAGRYQLRVEFAYHNLTFDERRDETTVSNPITIEIEEPRGNNQRAFDYLKNVYEPARRGSNTDLLIEKQQHFVDNFRNSVYWKYITFDLATIYLMFKDYEKADRELLKIIDINFHHSQKVKKNLSETAKRLGRPVADPRIPLGVPVSNPNTIYRRDPDIVIQMNPVPPIPPPIPVSMPSPTLTPIPTPTASPVVIATP